MKIVIFNLGCKVNDYECDVMFNKLLDRGYEVSNCLEYADYYIINTCAVTKEAERKSRQAIARALKYNQNAKVYICGCASEHNALQFAKSNVVFVTGIQDKIAVTDFDSSGVSVLPIDKIYQEIGYAKPTKTRSFVKIQEGCNNFCSYCLIPYLRGRSRSRQLEDVIGEIEYITNYTEEIVLTGIDLSSYGKDSGTSLKELLERLKGYKNRFRLGSLEASLITVELLEVLVAMDNFCPQFHLSFQNGDDSVLKDMNRHYTVAQFIEKVELIRKYYSNANITTDIIVGYPTESEENFNNTIQAVRDIEFGNIHIFPYSKREGTRAYNYNLLDKAVVLDRVKRLTAIRDEYKVKYEKTLIGVKQVAIFEELTKDGLFVGHNEYLVKIYSSCDKVKIGQSISVTPIEVYNDGLIV